MKVLSLFDGMSCGQLALNRLGIKVDKYYASEIDKYAIQVTQANFPETIQIGDVCDVKGEDYQDIDIIFAGSPCQGFSQAGKGLAFDDPRSALFFEFIRLLKEIKPKYFLLENVKMKKEWLQIITEQVSACYPEYTNSNNLFGGGIEPILINSSLLSAQSRQRYYWTNIPNVKQPKDKGIVLKDILQTDVEIEYYAGKNLQQNYKGGNQLNPNYKSQANTIHDIDKKSETICAGTHGYANGYIKGKTIKKIDDLDKIPDKSHVIKAQYYKCNKRNFEATNGFRATGIPQKDFDDNLEKMTTNNKAYCLTATYQAAEPKNSLQRKQRTMIPTTKPIQVATNVETVKVRKHEVDVESLQKCLLDALKKSGKSKKQVAEDLNDKFSTVEHYFRKVGSEFFSIPSEEHWPQLKDILDITTDTFDKQIMEFEYRDGVYESSQRVYSEDGKSPTLTASSKDQIFETKPKQVGKVKDGGQGNRIYSQDGKSSTLSSQSGGTAGSGNLLIETKPKQVGIAADVNGHDILKRVYSPDGKSPTLSTCQGGNTEPKVVKGGAFRGRAYDKDGRRMDRDGVSVAEKTKQMLELRKDNKSNAITTVAKDSLAVNEDLTWRKLTPIECERLQTVPDNYTNHVSNTQRYKMLGNGWTIDVICHILKNMD